MTCGAIARAQQADKEKQEKEKQKNVEKEKEQRQFVAGVKDRLPPGEVCRATDFWRQGLKEEVRNNIKLRNDQSLPTDTTSYEQI